MDLIDRYRGALLGLAVGEALGVALEGTERGGFDPVADMIGGGPFALEPGQWTDATAMALCLATSLIERQGFDAEDQMQRYLRWHREGYLSSTGRCLGIANTVRWALHYFEHTGEPLAGPTQEACAGNSSLARVAPIPLAFATRPRRAVDYAAAMSRTTHGAPEPVDACRYCTGLMLGALDEQAKEELLQPRYAPVSGLWSQVPLVPRVHRVAGGTFKRKQPPHIRGSRYVVQTLEAALWAFWESDGFREGVLKAVNLGEDAPATGAIYGQLAGAYYGVDAIPWRWRGRLARSREVAELADGLFALAESYATEAS